MVVWKLEQHNKIRQEVLFYGDGEMINYHWQNQRQWTMRMWKLLFDRNENNIQSYTKTHTERKNSKNAFAEVEL